MTKYNK